MVFTSKQFYFNHESLIMNVNYKNFIKTFLTALAIGCVGFFVLVLLLQPVFSGKVILPQTFSIGSFQIHYYGTVLALAVIAGYWLATKRKKLFGIEDADSIIFWTLIGGFVGARAYHVISELPFYLQHPNLILVVWKGGLGIYGAGIGGALALYLYLRVRMKNNSNFLHLLDWLTPSIVIGQVIGRFGNFFNYEIYGGPTNLLWKMFVPATFRHSPYLSADYFHPIFLYESMGSFVILLILLRLKLPAGRLFLLWVLMYNAMRFLLEFLRVDSVIYGQIRVNAYVSLTLVLIAITVWKYLNYVEQNSSNS